MTSGTIDFYNRFAKEFQAQYLSTPANKVHASWASDYAPASGIILDVGAGVGRDARHFSEQGLAVVAVEPAIELMKLGMEYTQGSSVQWLNDKLPGLDGVVALQLKFDLILANAVWMHVEPADRDDALRKLSGLLNPGGAIIISLRHGPNMDERVMHEVSAPELKELSRKYGLADFDVIACDDTLGRSEVHWETAVMKLPLSTPAQQEDIVVGAFYQLPDGRITKTYGVSSEPPVVRHYFDDEANTYASTPQSEVLSTWFLRRDLSDFPNARDPRIHYDFDLFWDIKHISQLKSVIANDFQDPWSGDTIHDKEFFVSLIHKHGLQSLLSD